jgi:lambda repressor-like predicted transcriptional regulator
MAHSKIFPLNEVIAAYHGGMPARKIADKYGTNATNILAALRKAGVAIRTRGGKPKKYGKSWSETFVAAYQSGESILSIAIRLGVGQYTVWRSLKAEGIAARPHGLRPLTIHIPKEATELAYFAGIFDGEGSIDFRAKHRDRSIGCRLSITNTNPALIDWLLTKIGGKAVWRFPIEGTKRRADWHLYRARDIRDLLRAAMPFLIIKRNIAETALALFDAKFTV